MHIKTSPVTEVHGEPPVARHNVIDSINMQLDATLTVDRSELEDLLADDFLSESAIEEELKALEELSPASPGNSNWRDIEEALEALDRELGQTK